jgi:two-component sensor histidine kinase
MENQTSEMPKRLGSNENFTTPLAMPAASTALSKTSSRPWLAWTLLTSIWLGLILFFAAQLVAVDQMTWETAFTFALLDWGPWVVLSPLVLWFAHRVHIDGSNWRRTVPVHVLVGLLIAAGLEVGVRTAWEHGWMPRPRGPWTQRTFREDSATREGALRFSENTEPPRESFSPPLPPESRRTGENEPRRFGRRISVAGGGQFVRARLALPIYFLLVAAAHAITYHRRSLERERRALTAESQLASARLMALQNQLNPHFLFNTLNGISSLVYVSPEAADDMICSLSELLRSVLEVSERKEVSLREELQFIDRYLSIQRMRFADRLESHKEIPAELETALVPTLILQPLVENAVVHGIAAHSDKGIVTVRAERSGPRLIVTVSDTGRGAGQGTKQGDGSLVFSEGIGLTNTRARLAALYGNDSHLTLASSPSGGVIARLDLPYHAQGSAENSHPARR